VRFLARRSNARRQGELALGAVEALAELRDAGGGDFRVTEEGGAGEILFQLGDLVG